MYRPLFLALALACRAVAQPAPRLSGSLALGPSTTVGGEFRSASGLLAELAGAARIASVARVAFLGALSFGALGGIGDVTDICVPSIHGGCKPAGATLSVFSLHLGIESALGPHLHIGASLGAGWADNGGRGPGGAHVFPFQLTTIVPVVSHIALLGRVERMAFRDYGGENFHTNALLAGLRVW